MKSKDEPNPLCICGCGKPVRGQWARRVWSNYVHGHHRNNKMSDGGKARLSERMKKNNPMKQPEVAAKVSAAARSKPAIVKSDEWKEKIASKARARMLSADNPMKDRQIARRTMAKILDRKGPSDNELHFQEWFESRGICLEFTGNGTIWINQKNPDYRVPNQKKAVEVTQKSCFRGELIKRDPDGYGLDRIRHCARSNWQCLVVFKGRARERMPEQLADVIRDFIRLESCWSGVWHFDKLLMYDAKSDCLRSVEGLTNIAESA